MRDLAPQEPVDAVAAEAAPLQQRQAEGLRLELRQRPEVPVEEAVIVERRQFHQCLQPMQDPSSRDTTRRSCS